VLHLCLWTRGVIPQSACLFVFSFFFIR
jgi:hypothetical protein